ncbi:uncharacterized protein LOC143216523 [Lasioglossum baleicum]|uniref:uncharacterized protein LOC143216523 n=1 Tax=Lasioglossum baleicum TaxID=434251 RepID=UPI003FCC517D
MFRHAIRCASRIALTKKSTKLHRVLLTSKNDFDINFDKKFFARTQTNFSNSPQDNHEDIKQPFAKFGGKLKLMFTCKKCNHRTSKFISKVAYEKGVVIVRCDGCKNNHLIADNLGWFAEMRNTKNIEKFLMLKGETVKRITNDVDGYVEVITKAEFDLLEHNRRNEERLIEEEGEMNNDKKQTGTSEDK